MEINTIEKNDKEIAIIHSNEILITDVQSALDFIATVKYETGCDCIILNKSAICEDFFHLSTRLAGEELEEALQIVSSTISKCEKAQLKFVEGTSHHTRFKKMIKAMHISKSLIADEISKRG